MPWALAETRILQPEEILQQPSHNATLPFFLGMTIDGHIARTDGKITWPKQLTSSKKMNPALSYPIPWWNSLAALGKFLEFTHLKNFGILSLAIIYGEVR